MNILITGVNGFIGKHFRNHFQVGHEIFTISRKSDKSSLSANDYEVDLSDVNFVKQNFTADIFKQNMDVIVHFAAVLSGSDNKDITIFYRNNAITESMIHIAGITQATKFINISSIGVYPNITGTYNEQSAIEPSMNHECLYSLAKVCSEELFKFYLKDTTQIVNLRLGQVYGKGMRDDRIFSIMKDELKRENSITVFGNGERNSNFVSIEYCINKIYEIIQKDEVQGTFNLGEKNLSYVDLAEMIIKEFGNSTSKIILNKKGVKSKVIIDCSKINSL
jgi:nucleoside-diphosphate-sugar epimerase